MSSKASALIATLIIGVFVTPAFPDAAPPLDASITATKTKQSQTNPNFKLFTGKIIGNHVRMRINPDLDSHVVSELKKDEYVVVTGEKDGFYAVETPANLKAYIFRGFIIDDVVEGDRVNIRLSPDREGPIIGHYSTGQYINGAICEENNKWLEINAPQDTRFYIAKEYVEYAGKPELKSIQDKRKDAVTKLLESTILLSQGEMRKSFHEIDMERITHSFSTIINDYSDFPHFVSTATKELATVQEDYLHRKIAFLEAKASKMHKGQISEDLYETSYHGLDAISSTDRMKIWEPAEEAIYLSWSSMHHAKTMDDFYADQKMKCQAISGILETYKDPVKNKPGDFILKDRDLTIGYLYSTQVNLEEYVNKRVTVLASPRSNNNFAFPAYYVIEVE